VVSGDSWSSAITRSFFEENGAGVPQTDSGVAFFFLSYIILGTCLRCPRLHYRLLTLCPAAY